MTEILLIAKVCVGWRICLTKDLCEIIKVGIGDRVVIAKNGEGEFIIGSNKVVT